MGWKRNPYNRSNGGPVATVAGFFSDPEAINLYKKQIRYIIARWGYSKNLLCWELWNEVDAPGLCSGNYKTHANAIKGWHRRISEYIDDLDINNHPVTTSFADSVNDPGIWTMEGIDLTTIHRYTYYNPSYGELQFDTVKTVNDLVAKRYYDTSKPVIIGEFALTPGGDIQRVYDQDGIAFHNQLWSSLMSSGAATAMHWNWGSYIHANNLYYHYTPVSLYLAGEDLRATTTFNNISRTADHLLYIGLQSEDKAYVWIQDRKHNYESVHSGYTPRSLSGEKLILTGLVNDTYTATYYDTRTGDIILTETVTASSGRLTLNLPDFKMDLAVKIY